MRKIIPFVALLCIGTKLFSQSCDLTQHSIAINNLCPTLQTTLSTGDATLIARDQVRFLPGFSISTSNLNGHTFTAKIDNAIATQTTSYEASTVNSAPIPALDKSNCIPGTAGGSVDVSPSGAATYQLPIQVSPGSHGMQPNLAIVYSSQSGNGLLGWGWNLAGISSITRVNKNSYYDGKFEAFTLSNNDALVLDGIRLIKDPITSKYYPANNPFTIVDFSNNIYTVTTQDGIVMEYGKAITAVGSSAPISWAISRITDADGNYIQFIYSGDSSSGEYRIGEIKYTGNSSTGKSPYNSIKFYYDKRNDTNSMFLAGGKTNSSALLTAIKVFSEGSLSKDYEFTYFNNQYSKLYKISLTADGVKFNPTYITWGASADYSISTADAGMGNLWSSQWYFGDFNGDGKLDKVAWVGGKTLSFYLNGASNYSTADLPQSESWYYGDWLMEKTITVKSVDIVDINNDGKDEMLVHYTSFIQESGEESGLPVTYLSERDYVDYYSFNGSAFVKQNYSDVETQVRHNKLEHPPKDNYTYYYADLNNDGIVDKLVRKNGVISGLDGIPFSVADVKFIDFNGDGRVDILATSNTGQGSIWEYNESGYINLYNNLTSGYFGVGNTYLFTGDFNGDGKTDFITKNSTSWYIKYSTGTGFVDGVLPNDINTIESQQNPDPGYYADSTVKDDQTTARANLSGLQQDKLAPALAICTDDINNDGKSDLVFARSGYIYIYLSNGFTFTPISTRGMLSAGNDTYDPHASIYLASLDLNNDGQKEILYGCNDYYKPGSTVVPEPYKWVTFNNKLDRDLYVNSITDGMGSKSEFTYSLFTNNRIFDASYAKPDLPLMLVRGPIQVVNYLTIDNQGNSIASIKYTYLEGLNHIEGNGFLGFQTVKSENYVNGISTTSYYNYEIPNASGIYYTWLISQEVRKSGQMVSTMSNTIEAKNLDLVKKSFIPLITSSTSIDKIKNVTTTKTIDTFDETIGRVTLQSTSTTGWNITTSLSYSVVSGNKSRLESTTTSSSHSSDNFTSTVSFGYSGSYPFRVISRTAQGLVTELSDFDSYGNPRNTKIGTRSTSCKYDDYGRFLVSSTDLAGNTTTAGYRSGDGAKLWEEDPNHNRKVYAYSNGGNSLVSTVSLPNNNVATTTLSWDDTYGLYKVESKVTNGDNTTTYFNALGQKIYVSSRGYAGSYFGVSYTYDTEGKLITEDKSGFPLINYDYDSYGRVYRVNDGKTINTWYSYSGLTVTTHNNIAGTTNTQTYDALGNITQVDGSSGLITYDYTAAGKVKLVTTNGLTTTMTYDPVTLDQLKVIDPDAGTTTYTYNSFGQMLTQQDNKGQTISCSYDDITGLLISKAGGTDIAESYEYYTETGKKGLLKSATRNSVKESYTYDNLYRPITVTTNGAGKTFTTTNEYNNIGQLIRTTHPTGLKTVYGYDDFGYLSDIFDDSNMNNPLWHGNPKNSRQQWTSFNLGNGLTTKWGYDDNNMIASIKTGLTGGDDTSIQNLSFTFNSKGQLLQRAEGALAESFEYDGDGAKLNRLTSSAVTGQTPVTFSYLPNGNISSTSLTGTYSYDSNHPHAVHGVTGIANPAGQSPSLTTTSEYTSDNRIAKIDNGTYKNEFTYGPSGYRYKVDFTQNGILSSKIYVGSSEFVLNSSGEITTRRTFIYAPTGICAVWEKEGPNPSAYHYIHCDYLGSWLTVTDKDAVVENRYSYDAWGRPRDPDTWQLKQIGIVGSLANLYAMQPRFDRGYTGHEHMPGLGLINMNGRIYDPYLQRFLSPDPFVQSPGNSQSYNRYSYCLNNPLMYIDPSGYNAQALQSSDVSLNDLGYHYTAGYKDMNWLAGMIAGTSRFTYVDNHYVDKLTGKIVSSTYVEKHGNAYMWKDCNAYVSAGDGSPLIYKRHGRIWVENPDYLRTDDLSENSPSGGGGNKYLDAAYNFLDPLSDGLETVAGSHFTASNLLREGYWLTKGGKYYPLSAAEQGKRGWNLLQPSLNSARNEFKWFGRVGTSIGYVTAFYSGVKFSLDPSWENGIELTANAASMAFWEIGAAYTIFDISSKSALLNYNLRIDHGLNPFNEKIMP